MTAILLINVHSGANSGDAALTEVAIQQLKENFPGCEITLLMDDPKSYTGTEKVVGSFFTHVKENLPDGQVRWHKFGLLQLLFYSLLVGLSTRFLGKARYSKIPSNWRSIFQSYLESDLVVSAPGGFLYSSGKVGLVFLLTIYTLAFGWLIKKPVYVLPQSIGPLEREWERKLTRWMLDRVRIVMVREEVSYELLHQIGLNNPRCFLLPDMAFAFCGAEPQEAKYWLQLNGIPLSPDRPKLGITVVNWGAENKNFARQKEYEGALEAAARFFIQNYQGEVIFFTQVYGPSASQDDRVPAARIVQRLSTVRPQAHMINQPVEPGLLKAIYGEVDLLVGTRMHSNIFSLTEGTPIIAIAYQFKTVGIARMLGLERWVIPIQEITAASLIEMLSNLWEERADVRSQILQKVPDLIENAKRAGKLIASDYQSLSKEPRP